MSEQLPQPFTKPATLRGRVEEYLRTAIMEGRLKGGERLREQELCQQLDISRPTLREALRTLEAERLIAIEPHRSPSVVRITEKAAGDLYALRQLLEGFASHEFARLADDASIAKLRQTVQRLHETAAQDDKGRLLAAKRDFYDVLLGGCGNELIKDMLPSLLSRINLLRATSFARPERLTESLAEIDWLFDRILARDPEGAREAASAHILNARHAALAVLRQQNEDSSSGSSPARPPDRRKRAGGPEAVGAARE